MVACTSQIKELSWDFNMSEVQNPNIRDIHITVIATIGYIQNVFDSKNPSRKKKKSKYQNIHDIF